MVYLVIAIGLLVIELLVWWLTHHTTHTPEDLLAKVGTRLERHISRGKPFSVEKKTQWQQWRDVFLSWFTSNTFRDVMRNFILRPGEVTNAAWLVYIVMAQSVLICPSIMSNPRTLLIKFPAEHSARTKLATAWRAFGPSTAASSTSKTTPTTPPTASTTIGARRRACPSSSWQPVSPTS